MIRLSLNVSTVCVHGNSWNCQYWFLCLYELWGPHHFWAAKSEKIADFHIHEIFCWTDLYPRMLKTFIDTGASALFAHKKCSNKILGQFRSLREKFLIEFIITSDNIGIGFLLRFSKKWWCSRKPKRTDPEIKIMAMMTDRKNTPNLQNVGDDTNAPHVGSEWQGLVVDNLRTDKFRCS